MQFNIELSKCPRSEKQVLLRRILTSDLAAVPFLKFQSLSQVISQPVLKFQGRVSNLPSDREST